METEIVKITTRMGNVEFHREELREILLTILKKVNKDGTKVWETPIGKCLKVVKEFSRKVKHGK